VNPFSGTIEGVFLLPDWDELFDGIDGIAAGLECLGSMRAAHRNCNTHLADRQASESVYHFLKISASISAIFFSAIGA